MPTDAEAETEAVEKAYLPEWPKNPDGTPTPNQPGKHHGEPADGAEAYRRSLEARDRAARGWS